MHYFMGELRCHAIQEAFELRSDESHASPASEDARISPTSMLFNLKKKHIPAPVGMIAPLWSHDLCIKTIISHHIQAAFSSAICKR